MIIKPLVDKKPKFKKLKFKPLNIKPIFDNSTDWDKDGVINRLDCVPLDPTRQGLMELIRGRKAKKELANAKKLDLPIEEEYEKELKEKISQGEKEKEFYKKNIKESFKDVDKNFDKIAKAYVRRDEKLDKRVYQKKKKYGFQQGESKIHPGYARAVTFLVPSPQKLFGESSIPDMSFSAYESFKPDTTGNIFRPPTFVPPDLQRKRERERLREIQRQQLREYYQQHPSGE